MKRILTIAAVLLVAACSQSTTAPREASMSRSTARTANEECRSGWVIYAGRTDSVCAEQ